MGSGGGRICVLMRRKIGKLKEKGILTMDLFKDEDKYLYVSEDREVVCGSYSYKDTPEQFFVTAQGKTFCFSEGFDFSEIESYGKDDVFGKIIYYKFIVKNLLNPLIVSFYQKVNFYGVVQKKFESKEEQDYILRIMELFSKKYHKNFYRWDIHVDFELSEDVKNNISEGVYLK